MKLGSLFDGSGGFPLAGVINGMQPVWASEIEPYPLKVTEARFPNMKQLGDVTKIDGTAIEPVDVITFGSPCQDLSIAGKQAGIHEGERSNLFFEAIRIIKEMREHDRRTGRTDEHLRPRFAVWENVPGAFSSNKGADFQAVLQALCEVKDADASVPLPDKGKWQKAGCIVGNGYSIAWRVYDAQFWGVPQRRKRIYLIADFGSERAGEILFERESVCWNSAQGGETREGTSEENEGSAGGSSSVESVNVLYALEGNGTRDSHKGDGWKETDTMYTLNTIERHAVVYESHPMDSRVKECGNTSPTVTAKYAKGTADTPLVVCKNTGNGVADAVGVLASSAKNAEVTDGKISPCLIARAGTGGNQLPLVAYPSVTGSLCANFHPGSYTGQDAFNDMLPVIEVNKLHRKYIVRRLTPLECCRLQGFPDWWEDGVEGSDSARYKMWGNGIALPCAVDVLCRVAKAAANES